MGISSVPQQAGPSIQGFAQAVKNGELYPQEISLTGKPNPQPVEVFANGGSATGIITFDYSFLKDSPLLKEIDITAGQFIQALDQDKDGTLTRSEAGEFFDKANIDKEGPSEQVLDRAEVGAFLIRASQSVNTVKFVIDAENMATAAKFSKGKMFNIHLKNIYTAYKAGLEKLQK
jgi:hypothetical protein